ncbi:hypothetical protein [Methyloradius palustris]|uniref:DUF3718 domain-containing protein n=1 Tax=Methyloradius palustris TaxID=2778876 RepID=A0A8D5GCX7_9PROT|nr:hypothetical protein [Methyloradius palustris]BCM25158.1 hypothetical protein ZMTM_14170 [Methyloradius palustris]
MKIHYALLTLLLASNYVYAEDLQYNRDENVQAEMLNRADIKARYCMHTTAEAFLANGMRDQQNIVDNLVKVCGGQMKVVYAHFQLQGAELVDDYLVAMAYDELNSIPGVKLASSQTKKTTNQTYAGTNGVNRKPMGDTDKIGN